MSEEFSCFDGSMLKLRSYEKDVIERFFCKRLYGMVPCASQLEAGTIQHLLREYIIDGYWSSV
ncbi:MAG: hypothetical protein QXO76_08215 [Thermoproteota archaeon]